MTDNGSVCDRPVGPNIVEVPWRAWSGHGSRYFPAAWGASWVWWTSCRIFCLQKQLSQTHAWSNDWSDQVRLVLLALYLSMWHGKFLFNSIAL